MAKIAEYHRVTYWGCSPRYLQELEMTGCIPKNEFDVSCLRMVQTGGSHLGEDQYHWFYRVFPTNVHLTSVTGGTDLVTSWIGTDPAGPLYAGEIQLNSPCLGTTWTLLILLPGESIKALEDMASLSVASHFRQCLSFSGAIWMGRNTGTRILIDLRIAGLSTIGRVTTLKQKVWQIHGRR
jgi:acyl-coenzyme A synthetase/AMP-(fatty) acid ligase